MESVLSELNSRLMTKKMMGYLWHLIGLRLAFLAFWKRILAFQDFA